MALILSPFNPRKETVDLNRHPANGKAYSSVVLLVDSAEQTRTEVCYGVNDQPIALELNALGIRTHCRLFKPDQDDFKSVCDLLLQFDEPLIYRTSRVGARKGYLVSRDELHSILQAALEKQYKHLSLENFEVQYDSRGRFDHFNGVDVVFEK